MTKKPRTTGKKPKAEMQITTLVLPAALHRELKKAAIDESRHMQDLLADAVGAYLEQKHASRH